MTHEFSSNHVKHSMPTLSHAMPTLSAAMPTLSDMTWHATDTNTGSDKRRQYVYRVKWRPSACLCPSSSAPCLHHARAHEVICVFCLSKATTDVDHVSRHLVEIHSVCFGHLSSAWPMPFQFTTQFFVSTHAPRVRNTFDATFSAATALGITDPAKQFPL